MNEALRCFLKHALERLKLNRVEADIDPRNGASARTLERLGFTREGFMRERLHRRPASERHRLPWPAGA